jgi:hypothetical protein
MNVGHQLPLSEITTMSSIILIVVMIVGNALMDKLSGVNGRTHLRPDEYPEDHPNYVA